MGQDRPNQSVHGFRGTPSTGRNRVGFQDPHEHADHPFPHSQPAHATATAQHANRRFFAWRRHWMVTLSYRDCCGSCGWGGVGVGGCLLPRAGGAGSRAVAPGPPQAAAGAGDAAAPAAAAPAGAAPAAAPAYSGTNDYVAGVDEPDLVKTDGRRIVTVANGVLQVIDAASRTVTGRLDLSATGEGLAYQPGNLMLSGDHSLLLTGGGHGVGGAN